MVSKRNQAKTSAMLEDASTEYSADAERMYYHNYPIRCLESKRPFLEIITYEGYEYRLRIIISYFSEHKILLTELKPAHIRDFYNSGFVTKNSGIKKKMTQTL